MIPDGMHQVSFAESCITVDDERAVRVSWGTGNQLCCVEGHKVGLTNNEGIESES